MLKSRQFRFLVEGKHAKRVPPLPRSDWLRYECGPKKTPLTRTATGNTRRAATLGRTRAIYSPTAPSEGSRNSSAGRPGAGALALCGNSPSVGAQIHELAQTIASKEPAHIRLLDGNAPGAATPRPSARVFSPTAPREEYPNTSASRSVARAVALRVHSPSAGRGDGAQFSRFRANCGESAPHALPS